MAIDFDVLQGVLGIDVSKWIKGFSQAQESVDTFQSATESATNRVANAVDTVSQRVESMVTKTSAASAQLQGRLFNATDEGFKQLVRNAADAVGGFEALGKQIVESGLSVSKWLDNLEAGARQVDTNMQQVTASVDTMATSIEQSLDRATAAIDNAVSASANLSTIQENIQAGSSSPSATIARGLVSKGRKSVDSDERDSDSSQNTPAGSKFDVDAFMGGGRPVRAIDNAIDSASIGMDSFKPSRSATKSAASASSLSAADVMIGLADAMTGTVTDGEAFKALFLSIGRVLMGLAGPAAAATAVIGAIAGSIHVAYENSSEARDMWDSMMETITTTIDDFTAGVGEAWNAFWEENGQTIIDVTTDIGKLFIWIGSEAVSLMQPVVAFLGENFIEAFKAVLKIVGVLVDTIKFFVDIIQGDWVNAGRAAIKVYAGLAETLAYLIEVAGKSIKILTLGWTDGGAEAAGKAIRDHAAAHREVANALTEEEKAAREAEEAANRLSRVNRTLAAEKAEAAKAEREHAGRSGAGGGSRGGAAGGGSIGGPREPGVIYQDFGTKEAQEALASMTKGEGQKMLMQMKREIEAAMTPDADGVMDGGKANLILSKYKEILSQIPGFTDHEFEKVADVIKFRISQAMVNAATPAIRDMARTAIGDATQGSDIFGIEADKQAERDAKHASKPASTKSSGGGTTRATVSKGTPEARVVEALDAEKVGQQYGSQLASVTRDEAIPIFRKLGHDILRELKPDANGIIDPKNAETVLNNYRAVLSQMPGFASEEFEKVAAVIRKQIAMATHAGGNELIRSVAATEIDKATGKEAGGKVFKAPAPVDPDAARKQWIGASGNDIQGAMGEFAGKSGDQIAELRNQNLAGVKGADGKSLRVEDDMRQLVQFKQQVMAAMAEARKATGEAKEDAVNKVQQLLGKYNETYDKIKSKIEGTYQSAAKASEDSASKQVNAAGKVKEANDKVTAPQGAKGGGSSGSSGGRNQSEPVGGGLFGGLGSMMSAISGIGQALAAGMNAVGGAIGGGMLVEAQLEKAITDPIQKIELSMRQADARLDQLMHNMGAMSGGTMQQALERNNLRDEMQRLSKAREDALRQREIDRQTAAEASARWEREVQAKRRAQEALAAEALKETQMSIVKALGNGPQTAITINGVNDPRQVFDVLEREALRRGLDMSGRRGANFGAKK